MNRDSKNVSLPRILCSFAHSLTDLKKYAISLWDLSCMSVKLVLKNPRGNHLMKNLIAELLVNLAEKEAQTNDIAARLGALEVVITALLGGLTLRNDRRWWIMSRRKSIATGET